MTWPQKGMAVGVVGMLLGAGLCGAERFLPRTAGAYFGPTSVWGAVCIVLFLAILVVSFVGFLVDELKDHLGRRR